MKSHSHDHGTASSSLEKRFLWALLLNGGLAIGEIVMSIFTNSTALLADGLNNVDDVAALLLSLYSERKAQKGSDEVRTFGYKRMDVLAGFAKGCFLLISAFLVLFQVGHFLFNPAPIAGITVIVVAGIALLVNMVSAFWFKEDSCHSLNARGTYLCMVYDAFGSLAVMVSGVLTMMYGFAYFDIAASLLIAAFMVKSGWNVLGEGIRIFLQSAPEGFDYDTFEKAVLSIENVSSVGDIHVWSLTPVEHHLTCKVGVELQDICKCDRIVKEVEEIVRTQFNIQHSTIQLTYSSEFLDRFCAIS